MARFSAWNGALCHTTTLTPLKPPTLVKLWRWPWMRGYRMAPDARTRRQNQPKRAVLNRTQKVFHGLTLLKLVWITNALTIASLKRGIKKPTYWNKIISWYYFLNKDHQDNLGLGGSAFFCHSSRWRFVLQMRLNLRGGSIFSVWRISSRLYCPRVLWEL